MKRLRNRIRCRLRGHLTQCTTILDINAMTDRHTHTCPRCKTVTRDTIAPISNEMLELALGMAGVPGTPVDDQRTVYVH